MMMKAESIPQSTTRKIRMSGRLCLLSSAASDMLDLGPQALGLCVAASTVVTQLAGGLAAK